MRAFVNGIMALNLTSIEKASFKKIAAYSEALRKTNESRPGWWRFIHPFRNRAEQKAANNFANFAKSINGQRAFENTVAAVSEQTSPAISELKQNTLETMLGVSDVNDYVPENDVELSPEQLKQKEIQEWMDKYNGKGFLADINKNSEREKLPLDQLKEDPYVDNGGNEKIDEPAIDQPKLEKQV